jgi:hypothetical protein
MVCLSIFGGLMSAIMRVEVLYVDGELAPAEIREILRATADKIDKTNADYDENGWSSQYGFGRVNAATAVQRAAALVT